MNTEDVTLDIEGRTYVNPQTGLQERMQFIDTLRDVQAQNTAEINQNTYNLGSQVPSNVGGLTGSEGLWQAQYQTPQVDAQVTDLRAVAQQQALNQEVQNLQGVYQNRYKQALRNFYARRKAENDRNNNPQNPQNPQGDIKTEPLQEGTVSNTLPDGTPNVVTSGPAGTMGIKQDNYTLRTDPSTGAQVREYDDGHIDVLSNGNWSTTYTPQQQRESVSDAMKRLQNEGKTVTNKRIQADKDGNVVLNYTNPDGSEGSETIKVELSLEGNRSF